MKKIKATLILHPVRMQIVQYIIGKEMTATQLSKNLKDVPQPSLYRHLALLVEGGILEVINEIPKRGTVEKVYALAKSGAVVSAEEVKNLSKEEHMQSFLTFMAGIMKQYGNYLEKGDIDLEKDGVGYRQIPLELTDTEFQQMTKEISEVVKRYMEPKKSKGKKKRIFTTIVYPDETKERD